MRKQYYMSEELYETIQQFLTGHNMAALNQNLRRQFIDYLDYALGTGVPVYFEEFLFLSTAC